jgi:probable phosphoglycerate mutase
VTGRRLLLLRHGRTSWNRIGRAQGHYDVGLDDLGHEQAAACAPYLATLRPAALWTSDLARARQTSAYVERATGLSAKVDERLREYDVGARQGMTAAQFEAAFPEAYLAWRAGESLASLTPGETGIVVTHGACLKVGLLGLLGWPRSQAISLRGVGNCAWATVAEVASGGRLRLEGYNERVGPTGEGMVDL